MSKELQKELRDEMRLTAAMRCFSILRSGGSKSTSAQHDYMFNLFHGDGKSIPSNIEMLCSGSYFYKDLYDAVDSETVLSKSDNTDAESRISLSLKANLYRDSSRTYFANVDILAVDMEKKGRNGKQLVSGRNLLDMAKKGTANYRKALSFAVKKFDLDKMEVLESGNSVEDVIEYVRCEMYKHLTKQVDNVKKKTITLDCDSDELDDNKDLEDEYLTDLKNTTSNESSANTISSSIDRTTMQCKSKSNKDETNYINPTNENKKTAHESSESTIETKTIPPKEWFFPSWVCFLTFGPFVSKEKRLALLEITDTAKNVGKSRSGKRKAEKLEKDNNRVTDNTAERGFSTDQKIQLELVGLTRISTTDRSRESRLMGLCVQEQALTKQIDRAERIAEKMAPDEIENMDNKWWKKVHILMKQQEEIILQMANLNNTALDQNNGGGKENLGSNFDESSLTNK